MPVYRGFRGQEQAGIRVTKGSSASEGDGVYIALDRDLAVGFMHSEGYYLQELEFRLDNPLVIRDEPLYMLTDEGDLEASVESSDSDWLKASKLSYQMAMKNGNNNWSRAVELVGFYLTGVMRGMGYDGVIVDQGKDNRWAVVFDPKSVKVLKAERHAHVSREARLAWVLVRSHGLLRRVNT